MNGYAGTTLSFNNATLTGNPTFNVGAGVTLNLGKISGNYTITTTGSGSVVTTATAVGGLNIPTGRLSLAVGSGTLSTGSLSFGGTTNNWTGQLDLSNNALDVQGGVLATITNQIKQGYAAATFTGQGIISSSAAANAAHNTTIGVIQNNQNGTAIYTASNLFAGVAPNPSDVLVRYTYFGDSNLDGKVDGSDYSAIDNGFNKHLTGWFNGDYNYDGVVDGSDYTLIDNAFDTAGGIVSSQSIFSTPAAQFAAVPEPASVAGAILLATALIARRRS